MNKITKSRKKPDTDKTGDKSNPKKSPSPPASSEKSDKDSDVRRLKKELAAAQKKLRKTVEDLKHADDMIRNITEEHAVVNEELRSANEQLSSANKELAQSNQRLEEEISLRMWAEDAVRKERKRLYDVLETLPVYVILLTPDYHVPFANRFFRERFGEASGMRCYEYLFGRTEPCEICDTYTVLKTGRPHRWEWLGPDGRNYDIYDYPFTDADGSSLILEMGIDITELKEYEAALLDSKQTLEDRVAERTAMLAESEARYHGLFMTMNEGFAVHEVICDVGGNPRDYRFLEINPAFERLTGLKAETVLGKTVLEIMPDTEQVWIDRFGHVALTGEPDHFESFSGQLNRWFEVYAYQTEPGRFGVMFLDVTERKNHQEAVSRAKKEWEKTFDTVPDLIAILDNRHRVVRANKAMADRLGRRPEQCVGLPCYQAVHGTDAPPAYCPHTMTIADGVQHSIELYEECLGGHFLISTTPLVDDKGKIIGSVHVARDITEIKSVEKALRHSEAQLQTILENLTEGLVVATMDGHLFHWNKAAVAMHGFENHDEYRRRLPEFADIFELAALDGTVLPVDQWPLSRILRDERLENLEIRIRRVHTDWQRILNYGGAVVRDEWGQPLLAVVTVSDITERKHVEMERETTIAFLQVVNSSKSMHELIASVTTFFQRQSGCAAVGIRLRQGDDFPYYEYRGFPDEFIQAENSLCALDKDLNIIRDFTGNPIFECMCGNVICGRFDPAKPFFTPHGSFWTNSTTRLIASATEADMLPRTRNRCNQAGYESVALLPLFVGKDRLGLLQLNDPRQEVFSIQLIRFLERLADYLAMTIGKFLAEESLRENREDLNRAQEVARTGSWRLNVAKNKLLWSDEAHRIFGISPGVPMSYETFMETVHPDDREYVDREWKACLGGAPYDIEHRIVVAGNVKWVREKAELEFDGNGELLGGFGTTQDITDIKQAESFSKAVNSINQTLLSTLKFDHIMETAIFKGASAIGSDTAAISLRKENQWIVSWVHGFPESVIGTRMSDEENPHAVLAVNTMQPVIINDAYTDDRVNNESMRKWGIRSVMVVPVLLRKQAVGAIFFNNHTSAAAFSDAHLDFGIKLAALISLSLESARLFEDLEAELEARGKVNRSLREKEARFRLLAEIAEKLLKSEDPEGIVDFISRKVMEHLDCQACFNFLVDEEAGKLHLNACIGIPDEEAARIEWLDYGVAVCGCAARDGVPIIAENIFNKVDPRTELVKSFGIQAYACHPMIVRGHVIGTLSFGTKTRASFSEDDLALMRTVTHQVATAMERMRLIEELHQHQDVLETRVGERTAELKKANEALARSNKALGEFAYVASHDLQEPLRKIRTFADRLKSMPDLGDDKARDYLARMDKASGRMRTLIQDLLAYSRLAANLELFTPFNLKEPVEEALTDLQVVIEDGRGIIDIGALPDVTANRSQMRQLFQNLISNALKYQGDQEPVIKIYDASSERGRFYEIHVQDNGIGFDEIYLDKIFLPFQRLHGKSDLYQGTGIGLAICRRIVENHGGIITARSQPGKGSTFIVKLPRKKVKK
ncbi:MAG: PAS domain S-box protein [Desulfobacteraceae bacterium]|jgi:PAS domain S-box-containing protein|nr:MAG: PAS domain S-box protein [Desulfobacteraceae bacterium]